MSCCKKFQSWSCRYRNFVFSISDHVLGAHVSMSTSCVFVCPIKLMFPLGVISELYQSSSKMLGVLFILIVLCYFQLLCLHWMCVCVCLLRHIYSKKHCHILKLICCNMTMLFVMCWNTAYCGNLLSSIWNISMVVLASVIESLFLIVVEASSCLIIGCTSVISIFPKTIVLTCPIIMGYISTVISIFLTYPSTIWGIFHLF